MNIGLIAHDPKRKLMQNFCTVHGGILSKNELFATDTIGRLIEEMINLNVHKYLVGRLGGEQQPGMDIERNQLDLVIFLREPLAPKRTDPDSGNIARLCGTHNIPLVTNLAIAELLIRTLGHGSLERHEMHKQELL